MGDPDPILGSFRLLAPLAEGGMGQVWSARHVSRPVDAAVKVIGAHSMDDVRAAVLLAEVHSAARLSHPNIVAVYDAGIVDEQAARASGGRLQAGGPWYAMERVEGVQIGRAPWPDVRRWLLQLLDALGHAHARGVVHRDLKPSNVLIDSASEVRLVDFGMALSVDPSGGDSTEGASASSPLDGGTPTWMSPEQFAAPRSLHGPWTDLYAVGLLAWALACGRAPYQSRSTWRLMRMHLQEPLPALAPVIGVPRGLEAWIRRCAAKSPADRYPRAVDAARALQALGGPVGVDGPPAPVVDGDTPTVQTARQLGHRVQVWQPAPAEPVPPSWRQVEAHPRPVDPAVLGLGLTRLRELPVVGREEEQDALWEALRDAAVGPRLVVVEGDAGVGKSRLARWLGHAVHSLGLGQPILAAGDPSRPDDAAAIVKRALTLADERPADLDEVLEARLGPDLAGRVRPLVAPRDGEPAVPVAEGVRLAAAVAVRLAGHRLPLLIVDDAQWSTVGLALADALLDEGQPALVLLTVRVDAADDDPQNAPHLDEIRERGDTLHVAPLQADATRALLHSLGALDPSLASTLEERAGGNPLFLLELVADWEARGVLAPGEAGWSLTAGASVPLPAGLAALWTERVEQLLASGPPTWEGALEMAAVLGGAIEGSEWSQACAAAGVQLDAPLLPTLVAQGLAVHEPGTRGLSWRLSHGMLRESLVERAERGGRLQAWDRAAAAMMEPRGRRLAARRAHHLERAGDRDAAIDAWLRAAAWLHEVDQRQALRVTEHAALLLEDSPEDDPRRDRLLYTRGRSLAFQGRPDDAGALADTLLERGRRRDSPATEGCGHLLWAILHRIAWDASGAVEAAERALACMLRLEVPENRVAEAWAELGFARFSGGDFVGAEDAFRHSGHTAFIPPMKVQADLLRSHCYHQLGDVARARRVLERTASRIPSGSDLMRGGVEIIAAELERHEGRTDEARRRVLAAIAATERRYRVPQARVVGLLAELWIDAGRPDEARRVLEQYDQPGRRDALEWASAEALVAAVSSDAQALDDVLTCIETDRSSQAVIAIARRLERTADRALGLDRELAARAGRLAVAAWERAHRTSDAKRVRAALWATGLGQGRPVG